MPKKLTQIRCQVVLELWKETETDFHFGLSGTVLEEKLTSCPAGSGWQVPEHCVLREMATWHSDIEMEETGCGGRAGVGRRGNMGGASGGAARGCIPVRHDPGTSYRDSGEIKFCISEYKNDAFQVSFGVKRNSRNAPHGLCYQN